MRKPQDKEFDARLKEKLEGFTSNPPASIWKGIDKELHQPTAGRQVSAWRNTGWVGIAASVCLLAAVGTWFVLNRNEPERENLVALSDQDSVSKAPEPGVIILNKSRSRNQPASQEAGSEQPASTQSGAKDEKEGKPKPPALKSKPDSAPQKDVQAMIASARSVKEKPASPDLAETAALMEPIHAQLRSNPEIPLSEAASVEAVQLKALNATVLLPQDIVDDVPEENTDGLLAPVIPAKIRDINGLGDAVNLAAATIDRSREKFLSIKKDEETGKWKGLRLDLGVITISYNKPTEKNTNARN